ncbi:hypothetical protein VL15_07660 [Burkholderia cepacia]|uniref:Cytochrome c domain-containing protein n=1 Tax=Burkholderia cepacia TaxID=292 RepID=A0A0J5XDT5_BURCE|nr:hypothetical protein [Burkholderia cepacia]KML60972.1 hypothetical protein VL15_07660 [Burkholderia cepacia]
MPHPRFGWRVAARLAGACVAMAMYGGSAAAAGDPPARGQALFGGAAPLQGRLSTHPDSLPPPVVRCANCHAAGAGPAVPNSLAPRLTHDWLTAPRGRRGGPLTRYDRDAFCVLLRTGVDPAYVLVNVEMPRYTLNERDCTALWRYLNGGGA